MITKLHELTGLGQSIWLGHIRRTLVASGGLVAYIQMGVRGVTFNPSIFENSTIENDVFNNRIKKLAMERISAQGIYDALVVDDVRKAADLLRPVFNETKGGDGFISLDINPHLAHDTDGSVREAERLFRMVNRPNLMIKIPATAEGLLAAHTLISEGVSVNVTLAFMPSQYEMIAESYISAVEKYAPKVETLMQIASVVSFPINRIDVKVDGLLDSMGTPEALALKGKIGIAVGKLVYHRFTEIFSGRRWDFLAEKDAWVQRLLFRCTNVNDKEHPALMYMDNLIGPYTVNNVSPETLDAFMDKGTVSPTLDRGIHEARNHLEQLNKLGFNLEEVTRQLLDEGIEKLKQAYDRWITAS